MGLMPWQAAQLTPGQMWALADGMKRRRNVEAANLAWALSLLPGIIVDCVFVAIGAAFEKDTFRREEALNAARERFDLEKLRDAVPGYDQNLED